MTSAAPQVVPYLIDLPQPGPLRRLANQLGWNFALVLEAVAIIALWQFLVVGARVFDPTLAPPPTDVLAAFSSSVSKGIFFNNLNLSLQNAVGGYAIAALVGIVVGILMGTIPIVATALAPFVWTLYATPRAALIPLIVLWFGFTNLTQMTVVFLLVVFPVLVNVMAGAQAADRALIQMGEVFGASRPKLYQHVILPFALPYTLTGLRLGIARALVGVVVAEHFGSTGGLGYMIVRASASFDLATSFAVLVVLFILANVGMGVLDVARRRLAPWYEESSA